MKRLYAVQFRLEELPVWSVFQIAFKSVDDAMAEISRIHPTVEWKVNLPKEQTSHPFSVAEGYQSYCRWRVIKLEVR